MTDLLNPDINQTDINPISEPQFPPLPPQPEPQLPPIQTQSTLPPLPPQQPQPQVVPPQPQVNTGTRESITTDGKFDMNKLKEILQKYLVDKCPIALPDSVKEFIVKVSPVMALIGVIISFPVFFAYFGISLISLPFASVSNYGFMHYVDMAKTIGSFIFEIIVLPGLFKRTVKVWNLLFYFAIFNLVFSVLTFNIGSIIVGTIISFYLLFQCRSKYIN
jgi:hypothetical protein